MLKKAVGMPLGNAKKFKTLYQIKPRVGGKDSSVTGS